MDFVKHFFHQQMKNYLQALATPKIKHPFLKIMQYLPAELTFAMLKVTNFHLKICSFRNLNQETIFQSL